MSTISHTAPGLGGRAGQDQKGPLVSDGGLEARTEVGTVVAAAGGAWLSQLLKLPGGAGMQDSGPESVFDENVLVQFSGM